jgi:predicted DNA-binding protein (MmcQ/YjbR family)
MTPSHMTLAEFNTYCQSFQGADTVVQWGGAHVWKVGGKVFAIGGWAEGEDLAVTFKVDPLTYDQLKSAAGCRPAPYLASRGMTWIQWTGPATVSSDDLRTYIAESYELVASKLTKAVQRRLGRVE